MKPYTLALAAALVLLPGAVRAQSGPVQPNDRLRFAAPAAGYATPVAGTVVEVRGGDLHLMVGRRNDPRALLVVVPVAAVTRLERSVGRASLVRTGAYGAVLGAALGALAGRLQFSMQSHQVDPHGEPRGRESHMAETTAAGAAIGALAGVLLPGERWRPLGAGASIGAATPNPGAAPGLGIRISF